MSDNLIHLMIKYNIIQEEDSEIYKFGMLQGSILLINIATSLIIGFLLDKLIECILLSVAYISIRVYAGGYHAKTVKNCYIASTVLIVCGLGLINILPSIRILILGVNIISLIIISTFAPQPSENKPLDIQEYTKYKSILHKILIIEIVIFFFLYYMRMNNLYSTITVAWIMESIMLIIGEIDRLMKMFFETSFRK